MNNELYYNILQIMIWKAGQAWLQRDLEMTKYLSL